MPRGVDTGRIKRSTTEDVDSVPKRLTFFRGGRTIHSPASPRILSSLAIVLRLSSMIGVELSVGGGMEPSPTRLRRVSGWNLGDGRCISYAEMVERN